jgi:hypothetical protein
MAQPRDKKRSDTAGISDVTGNFQSKPGAICRVFRKDLFVEPFVEKEWRWSGTRYALVANDWLDNRSPSRRDRTHPASGPWTQHRIWMWP